MATIKHYIQAARLRTLPLSVSGILVGTGIAASESKFNLLVFILAIVTTIGFQVLSNFANDYGDGIKGTDDERVGEQRLIASGLITPKQMKTAMIVTTIITLLCSLVLIYVAFGSENFIKSIVFFILGIVSIVAAIKYTVGKSAYGYSGLGDIFVFLFFGLLSVLGSYYLYTHELANILMVLPALAFGMLSTAVLNLNNMRDQIQDKKANKNTLVVKLGSQKAKVYHFSLIIIALILLIIYRTTQITISYKDWMFIIAFIPLFLNLKFVAQNIIFRELDQELKKVALSTFFCAILFALGSFL
ncbi:MAG: 1,4-dihydroxy-2-naphthoate octaprenyltransferase [Kordia sp.]|nr:MAG: 1,4-dihydroxy-2-naphthoate octaprenyltransferase [Kordia sp.]